MTDTNDSGQTSRRTLLAGAGVASVAAVGAVAGLAGCGSSSDPGSGSPASAPANGDPNDLGKATDIPVGGGKIFDSQKVVVTQPTSGTIKGFSAVCTHQGCIVSSISDGLIHCPCHGSMYSIVDGSVKGGPAPKPLDSKTVTTKNGELFLS